jgi:hypothetical protein
VLPGKNPCDIAKLALYICRYIFRLEAPNVKGQSTIKPLCHLYEVCKSLGITVIELKDKNGTFLVRPWEIINLRGLLSHNIDILSSSRHKGRCQARTMIKGKSRGLGLWWLTGGGLMWSARAMVSREGAGQVSISAVRVAYRSCCSMRTVADAR